MRLIWILLLVLYAGNAAQAIEAVSGDSIRMDDAAKCATVDIKAEGDEAKNTL